MYYVWKLLTNILAWFQSPYKFKVFNLAFFSTICWSETRLQDLFHKRWNCSTKGGTVPQKVELFHKKWNCSTLCRSSRMLPHFMGSCSTFLGRCSTNCGTVPQKVKLFHKKWNCSTFFRSSRILPKIEQAPTPHFKNDRQQILWWVMSKKSHFIFKAILTMPLLSTSGLKYHDISTKTSIHKIDFCNLARIVE